MDDQAKQWICFAKLTKSDVTYKNANKLIVSFAKSIVSYGNLCVVLSKPLLSLSESAVLLIKLMVFA